MSALLLTILHVLALLITIPSPDTASFVIPAPMVHRMARSPAIVRWADSPNDPTDTKILVADKVEEKPKRSFMSRILHRGKDESQMDGIHKRGLFNRLFKRRRQNEEITIVGVESLTEVAANSTAVAVLGGEATSTVEPAKEAGDEAESETQKLMKQVKEAGLAGIISYAAWEIGFWAVSVPVVLFGYREVTGHWPDLSDKEDLAKLGAEAFAFVNFARFAVPLRIGLALSTTPWVQSNIVDRFFSQKDTLGDAK